MDTHGKQEAVIKASDLGGGKKRIPPFLVKPQPFLNSTEHYINKMPSMYGFYMENYFGYKRAISLDS